MIDELEDDALQTNASDPAQQEHARWSEKEQGQRVKIHRTRVLTADGHVGEPGMVVRADRHGIEIACGEGVLVIEELQPDGKRRMLAEQFLAGNRLQQGTCFTSDAA